MPFAPARLRRTPFTWVAAATFALTLSGAAPAATEFPGILPGDSVVAIWANDVPAFQKGLDASAYGKFFKDPALEPLRGFIQKKIDAAAADLSAEEKLEFQEMMKVFVGGVAAYAVLPKDASEVEDTTIVFAIEYDEAGKAYLDKQLAKIGADLTDPKKGSFQTGTSTVNTLSGSKAEEEVNGFNPGGLDADKTSMFYQWTFLPKHFLLTIGEKENQDAIKDAVLRFTQAPAANSLKDRQDAKAIAEQVGAKPNQIAAFINSGTLLRMGAETSIRESEAESSVDEQGNPAPVDEAKVKDTMAKIGRTGLFDLESMYLTVTPSAEQFDIDFVINTPPQRQGVVAALLAGGETKLDMMKYSSSTALGTSNFTFDMGALYDAILRSAEDFSPGASGFVTMGIAQIQMQYQVDPVNGILKNIAGEHLSITREYDPSISKGLTAEQLQASPNSVAVFFALRNGAETSKTIKTLVTNLSKDPNMGSNLEVTDKGAATVVRFPAIGAEDSPLRYSLLLTKDFVVLVNNDVELQEVTRTLAGENAKPLVGDADYTKLLGEVKREGLQAFSYTPRSAIGAGFAQLRTLVNMGILGDVEGMEEFTADMIPTGDVANKYFGDSYTTLHAEEGAIRMKGRVLPATGSAAAPAAPAAAPK